MKPLVSILIPAYNAEEWIAASLESALKQTWERKEIIVVDDGSKDGTLDLLRHYESDVVHVYTQSNQGAAAARNMAFSLSHGDYIQWLDADDLLASDKITTQMSVLETCGSKRTLATGAWGRFLSRPYRANFVPTALWTDLTPVEWLVRKMGQNLYLQTANWLVSRELTEKAGPWNTQLLGDDDGEYFCRVILLSDMIRFVPDSKVYYRASGASSLSYIGNSERKMEAQWRSMQLHVQYVRSLEDSLRVRQACLRYLENWLVFFHPQRDDLVQKAQTLALELGGTLKLPRLSWKYSWIKTLFGWPVANTAQIFLTRQRWNLQRSLDRAMLRLEGTKSA